jgi:transposase InsO family protein
MTYLYYGKCEKAYLSATKDLGTNEIVSYRLMKTPSVSNFIEEFEALLIKLPEEKRKNLLIHSDQGFQYTHSEYVKLLQKSGVTQSMSRKGNCLDNAPIESFFGHFKDLLEIKDCKTFEDVEKEVKRSMDYYNIERPQKGLNKKPPAEYRGLLSGLF